MTMNPIIALITDFGTADGYVGEVKGVLLSQAPGSVIVDIAHDMPPQDIDHARLTIARVWRRFPSGVIFVVVVDPGVGSSRAALAVASDGRFLVGPDNGVLSPALLVDGAQVVELAIPATSSATFHGRDVFAPAAAALARGDPMGALGRTMTAPVIRRTPEPTRGTDGAVHGEVIDIDHFGNAVTNLIGPRGGAVEVSGTRIPVRQMYAEVPRGEPVAVVGSMGFIEIAVRDGGAAEMLHLARGSRVVLYAPR
jgi:S-adenosylmethionine hydrolase